jgi:hypothetical protein
MEGAFKEDKQAKKLTYHDGEWREEAIVFKVCETLFAKGAMRSAHVAYINSDEEKKFVAKRFLVPSEEDEDKYREDVIVQSVAANIAVL